MLNVIWCTRQEFLRSVQPFETIIIHHSCSAEQSVLNPVSKLSEKFLGAFAKLCKATVRFVVSVSVRPSVRMEHLGSHWTDFHEIWYVNTSCWSRMYLFVNLAEFYGLPYVDYMSRYKKVLVMNTSCCKWKPSVCTAQVHMGLGIQLCSLLTSALCALKWLVSLPSRFNSSVKVSVRRIEYEAGRRREPTWTLCKNRKPLCVC